MLLINLLSNICPGDWTQFLSGLASGLIATIIGTLLGIFGPFYLQSVNERKNKRKRAVQCLCDLKKELEGMKDQFGAIKDTDIYLNPIKTPVWDCLINTNEIQLLSLLKDKNMTSNTGNFTNQIFQIYDLINEYNLWCNMYTQGAVVGARSKKELTSIRIFINTSKTKLLCEDENDDKYKYSINYTLFIIDKAL